MAMNKSQVTYLPELFPDRFSKLSTAGRLSSRLHGCIHAVFWKAGQEITCNKFNSH
jgi:hypothetical protein